MSAELLREAAVLMRERATAAAVYEAAEGWWHAPVLFEAFAAYAGDDEGAVPGAHEDAEHIAGMTPAVALAVADLLDLAATHEKRAGDEAGQGYTKAGYGYVDPSCSQCGTPDEYAEPWPCIYATRALNLARAYLSADTG